MVRSGRIALGPLVASAGAVLLVVSLFLDWYDDVTGFTVFEALDLVLAGLAAATLLSLVEGLGIRPPAGFPLRPGLSLPLATLALVVVLSQIVNEPPAIVRSDYGPEVGLWLGLAGAALMVAGALLGITRVSLAVDVERRPAPGVKPGPPFDPDAPTATRPPVEEEPRG